VIAAVAYLAFFAIARPVTIDIGRFPDRLVLSGFNSDERDNGVTYRWTRTSATIQVPGYGGVRAAHLEVAARNGRGKQIETPYTVDLGAETARLAAAETFIPALADLHAKTGGDALTVRLQAERYAPGTADTRVLGVQVDRVHIQPMASSWWLGVRGGWPWALRLALLAVVIALAAPRRWSGLLGGGASAIVAVLAFVAPSSRVILPPLLVPTAIAVTVVAAVVRWHAMAALLDGVWIALDRPVVMRWTVGLLVGAYIMLTLLVVRNVDFIGHADYADNAVRARNIVRGRGDVIDYVPQFYRRFPRIVHPAETWPPLQVWMIAAVFRVLGVSTVVAKLPNIAVMAALLVLTAWIGAWRWSRRVGLLAALLLAATPLFFEDTLFPVNDLVFTLLFAAFIVALHRTWCEPDLLPRLQRLGRFADWMPDIIVGGLAGLLLLAKPSGAALIAGASAVAFVIARRAGYAIGWRHVGVAVAALIACYAPWVIRNLARFGTPFHSTETYDAWVLKYDLAQPSEGIYRVYWDRPLPHPRLLVGYGYDHFLTVQGQQFGKLWHDFSGGALVPRLLLPLLLIGALIGAARRPGFGAMLAGAAAPYTLFVLVYWHYEVRYFLVFMPWLLLLAAAGLEWLYDALGAWFTGMWRRALVPLLALVLLLAVVVPAGADITQRAEAQTGGNGMVQLTDWLKANTPPDAVVMTRNPWEVTWHSDRRTVMLPLGSTDDIYAVMRQYGVTVLALDHINDASTIRPNLDDLYKFKALPGITPLYDPHNDFFLVFRVAAPPG